MTRPPPPSNREGHANFPRRSRTPHRPNYSSLPSPAGVTLRVASNFPVNMINCLLSKTHHQPSGFRAMCVCIRQKQPPCTHDHTGRFITKQQNVVQNLRLLLQVEKPNPGRMLANINCACHLSALGLATTSTCIKLIPTMHCSEAEASPSRSWESFIRIPFALWFHPRATLTACCNHLSSCNALVRAGIRRCQASERCLCNLWEQRHVGNHLFWGDFRKIFFFFQNNAFLMENNH